MSKPQLSRDASETLPYKVVSVGTKYTVVQEDSTGRRVFTVGMYWDEDDLDKARSYCADLEHLRTQIPGQLTLFDSDLNPSLETQ